MALYDQYGNPIGQSDDAHVMSNYKEWKAKQRITDVDIDLSKLGVPAEKVQELYCGIVLAMKYKIPFALFTADGESIVTFIPEILKAKQGHHILTYANEKQFLNGIKLATLQHHEIHLQPEKKQLKKIYKQDADVCKYLSGRGILPEWRSRNSKRVPKENGNNRRLLD